MRLRSSFAEDELRARILHKFQCQEFFLDREQAAHGCLCAVRRAGAMPSCELCHRSNSSTFPTIMAVGFGSGCIGSNDGAFKAIDYLEACKATERNQRSSWSFDGSCAVLLTCPFFTSSALSTLRLSLQAARKCRFGQSELSEAAIYWEIYLVS